MVVGLVAHLSPDEQKTRHALEAMAQTDGLEIGESVNHRIPVVIDSPQASVESCTAWLQSLDGVIHVDVVYVHFDEHQANAMEGCSDV